MNLYIWLNKRHHDKITRSLRRSIDDLEAGRTKSIPFSAVQARWDELDAKRAAEWKIIKFYRWLRVFLFGWDGLFTHKLNPRNRVNQFVWGRQRKRRGWCDSDCWNIDMYISRVLSGMLAHLAEHNQAYPGQPPFETPEKWEAHLRDLSSRMRAWSDESFADEDAFNTTKEAMKEFASRLGFYWD
jgi:hypothetical protein